MPDKESPETIKVKIVASFGGHNAKTLKLKYSKQCKESSRWNRIELVDTQTADFYVILNVPLQSKIHEFYDPEKSIVFFTEPSIALRRDLAKNCTDGIKWGEVWNHATNEKWRDKFLCIYDTFTYHNSLEWHLSPNYEWFMTHDISKIKTMSTVCSSHYSLEGHRLRLDFLSYLDKLPDIDIFGFIYGNGEKLRRLQNYRGPLNRQHSLYDSHKDAGLFPYKYTFMAENSSEKGYFTEKIVDAILAECLIFYWGCPNIHDFITPEAIIVIDLFKPQEAFEDVRKAIENQEWEKRLPAIRHAKQKILNKLQIMPTIESIILEKMEQG